MQKPTVRGAGPDATRAGGRPPALVDGSVLRADLEAREAGDREACGLEHLGDALLVVAGVVLVEQGDLIRIDIPNRKIELVVDDATLAARRATRDAEGWKPAKPRKRKITTALRAYAAMTTSAAKGAVRVIPE